MEATRPTITDAKGKEVMSRLAKMWREMDELSQKPWNDKARAGQEKAKADFERWKGMSPDERLIHSPPSPSPRSVAAAAAAHRREAVEEARRRPTRRRVDGVEVVWRVAHGSSEKKKKKRRKRRRSARRAADPDADTQL